MLDPKIPLGRWVSQKSAPAPDRSVIDKDQREGFRQASIDHVHNFIESVLSRKTLATPVETGFQSALALPMANISVKQGRPACWNQKTQEVGV